MSFVGFELEIVGWTVLVLEVLFVFLLYTTVTSSVLSRGSPTFILLPQTPPRCPRAPPKSPNVGAIQCRVGRNSATALFAWISLLRYLHMGPNGGNDMVRGGRKPPARTARRERVTTSTSKVNDILASAPPVLQQRCLDIFKDALKPGFEDKDILQEVKGHLYDRNFAAAFGKEEYLRVYASRWSPSRALAYLQVFQDMDEHLDSSLVQGDEPLRVVCIGGGAGGELVGLAGRHSIRKTEAGDGYHPKLHAILVDMAAWSGVTGSLLKGIMSAPELSKYASQAKKDANKALLGGEDLAMDFQQQDVLNIDQDATAVFEEAIMQARLATFMFTLNELYSTSVAKTQLLLARLTELMSAGACLLVVDSPGSYSTVSVNGADKQYPMQWLLDHTLIASSRSRDSGTDYARWEKVVSDDSRWFRLPESMEYPIELENMRYQIHLYRKLSDVGG